MATEISRIDRLTRTYALADYFPGGLPTGITAASLALLPPSGNPTAATVWTTATYASGSVTVLLAGPDADSAGALVVPASADLWVKVDATPQVDAEKLERITVLGGGGTLPGPPPSDASVAALLDDTGSATYAKVVALIAARAGFGGLG